jgi:hypothetical protein
MKCEKIVAHIRRTNEKDKINKTIVAFNQRFHLVSVSGFGWNEVTAIYEPEDKLLEDK